MRSPDRKSRHAHLATGEPELPVMVGGQVASVDHATRHRRQTPEEQLHRPLQGTRWAEEHNR